jgi:hypothetical protein
MTRTLPQAFPLRDRALYFVDRLLARTTGGRARLFKYYIVAQPVATGLLPGRRGDSIAVREVFAGDPALAEFDRPAAVIASRFGQGARCLVATKAGRIVGCIWFVAGGYEEDEVRCRFEPLPRGRRAWDFDVFIHPDFRGSLVFPKLWSEAGARMRQANIEQTLSRISAFKPESLLAHARLGARVLARCAILKLGRWELFVSTQRPRIAFSGGAAGRPVLEIPS